MLAVRPGAFRFPMGVEGGIPKEASILHNMIVTGGQLPNQRGGRLLPVSGMKEAEIREPAVPAPIRPLVRQSK